MVLEDFSFEGLPLNVYEAYAGEEAMKIMSGIPDIALVMLDVAMETDDAGFRVVRYIREELKNDIVQIVFSNRPARAYSFSGNYHCEVGRNFIQKPFSVTDLFTIIRAALDRPFDS